MKTFQEELPNPAGTIIVVWAEPMGFEELDANHFGAKDVVAFGHAGLFWLRKEPFGHTLMTPENEVVGRGQQEDILRTGKWVYLSDYIAELANPNFAILVDRSIHEENPFIPITGEKTLKDELGAF